MQNLVGKKCIIRGYASGVFFGTVEEILINQTYAYVRISNCRRIWYWVGANSLSEVAVNGIESSKSKVCINTPLTCIFDCCELIECTSKAIKKLEDIPEWKIN